jgi:E3 ubiquitin-protein ligase TRIP12
MLEKRILCASGINEELTCNSNVTFDNVDVYMAKLIAFTAWYGIRLQIFSLVLGLTDVLSNVSLIGGLLPAEIRDLACGSPSVEWTLTDLQAHIKLQPGQYTMSSQPAQFFFTTLLEMNQSERQDFLRFVTGCPLLPIGGLAALNPPLTLMQKGLDTIYTRTSFNSSRNIDLSGDLSPSASSSSSAQSSSLFDKVLVSSSTCFHQIKLPPYSSLEVTKQMLRNSIVLSKGLIDMS